MLISDTATAATARGQICIGNCRGRTTGVSNDAVGCQVRIASLPVNKMQGDNIAVNNCAGGTVVIKPVPVVKRVARLGSVHKICIWSSPLRQRDLNFSRTARSNTGDMYLEEALLKIETVQFR